MSLLMDALRKAEEAKRRGENQEPEPDPVSGEDAAPRQQREPSFTLEPREDLETAARPEQTAARGSPPDTDIETIPFRDGAAAEAETPAAAKSAANFDFSNPEEFERYRAGDRKASPESWRRSSVKPAPDPDQLAAASMFEAKLPPEERKSYLRLLLSMLAIIFCAGTGVLLYLLNAPASSVVVNPSLAANPARGFLEDRVPPLEQSPAASEAGPGTLAADAAAQSADENESRPASADADTRSETPSRPQLTTATNAPPPRPGPATDAAANAPAASPETPAPAQEAPGYTLVIERKSPRQTVDPELQRAYASFRGGDLDTAAGLYRDVLERLPNNRDALLGLASIHGGNGEFGQARTLYLRLLTLNPRDPIARTGLLQSMRDMDAPTYERQLKALLGDYPGQASLHFALGNLYAGQGRWSDAQAAYFEALLQARRDDGTPVSPDYAFNLAVSLEQLSKPGPALQYYREAQQLAAGSRAGFDPERLLERLRFLERSQP